MRSQLDRATALSGRSLGQEIELRLEQSFAAPSTQEVRSLCLELAVQIAVQTNPTDPGWEPIERAREFERYIRDDNPVPPTDPT
jgi:hypothetical protein